MKISRLIGFLVLAILVGVSFSLTPVTAGEHPWNEDEFGDGGDTVYAGSNGSEDDGDDPLDPDETLLGTSLFWWQMIIDPIIDPNDALNAEPTLESETDGAMR